MIFHVIVFLVLKYPIKMKQFGLMETKLFHFHRIFKTEMVEFKQIPLNPPLVPTFHLYKVSKTITT